MPSKARQKVRRQCCVEANDITCRGECDLHSPQFFALSHSTPQIGRVLCETLSTADKHRQRATNIDNTRSNKVRRLGTELCSPRQTLTKPDKNKTDIQAQRHSLPHFTLQQMATDIDKNGDQNSNSVAPGLRHSPIDTIRQTTTKADKH